MATRSAPASESSDVSVPGRSRSTSSRECLITATRSPRALKQRTRAVATVVLPLLCQPMIETIGGAPRAHSRPACREPRPHSLRIERRPIAQLENRPAARISRSKSFSAAPSDGRQWAACPGPRRCPSTQQSCLDARDDAVLDQHLDDPVGAPVQVACDGDLAGQAVGGADIAKQAAGRRCKVVPMAPSAPSIWQSSIAHRAPTAR